MIEFSANHPVFVGVIAAVVLVLVALTMRSVILRERAMVRQRRADELARAAYEARWRNSPAA